MLRFVAICSIATISKTASFTFIKLYYVFSYYRSATVYPFVLRTQYQKRGLVVVQSVAKSRPFGLLLWLKSNLGAAYYKSCTNISCPMYFHTRGNYTHLLRQWFCCKGILLIFHSLSFIKLNPVAMDVFYIV